MRMRAMGGFTLVEVMIVVAIISILASVALPAYQNYSLRAKVSEAILALSVCRTTVTELYQGGGTAPGMNNWGCESAGGTSKYVGGLSTSDNGMVSVTLQNLGSLNGKIITMTPLIDGTTAADVTVDLGKGLYGWRCGAAADGTTLDPRYLPGSCRS
jgi:type IV pilus assembly protein PilA